MESYKDSYFFNAGVALQTAKQNNKVEFDGGGKGTQLCYYNGKELSDAPKNCINVPMEDIVNYFATTPFRIPGNLDVSDSGILSEIETNQSLEAYIKLIKLSMELSKVYILDEMEKIRNLKIDFTEKNKRVFIASCQENKSIKKIFNNIEKSFKRLNFEFYHYEQKSDLHSCSKLYSLQEHIRFNPHIVFNINYIENRYLSREVYNFVLYTDFDSFNKESNNIEFREKDFIFTVDKTLHKFLNKSFIDNKLIKLENKEDYKKFIEQCLSKIE